MVFNTSCASASLLSIVSAITDGGQSGLCVGLPKNPATLLRTGSGWSAAAPAWQRQEGLNGHASAPAATATLWAAAVIERPVRSTGCVRR